MSKNQGTAVVIRTILPFLFISIQYEGNSYLAVKVYVVEISLVYENVWFSEAVIKRNDLIRNLTPENRLYHSGIE